MTSRSSSSAGKGPRKYVDLKLIADSIAAQTVGATKIRTTQGFDIGGHGFAMYSDRYDRAKKKTGRDSGVVDLTVTGAMLASVTELDRTSSSDGDSIDVTVGPSPSTRRGTSLSNAQLGYIHQHGRGVPVRKWLGLTDKDRKALAEHLRSLSGAISLRLSSQIVAR